MARFTLNRHGELRYPLCFVLLIVWGGMLYANTLTIPFYLDDYPNIVDRPAIKIERLDLESIEQVRRGALLTSRPLANLSFALNYLAGGENVSGYHLVNIAIHLLTACLLFLIIITLLRKLAPDCSWRSAVALWSSLLWLSHPIHTQSINYIVQRMNLMAAMFVLLAFVLYLKGREESAGTGKACLFYFFSLVAWLFGMGAKEIAAILPLLVLCYEWLVGRSNRFSPDPRPATGSGPLPPPDRWRGEAAAALPAGDQGRDAAAEGKTELVPRLRLPHARLWAPLALLVFTGLYLLLCENISPARILHGYGSRGFTLAERLLTEARVVVHYLSLLLYPELSRFSLEYEFPLSTSLLSPWSTLAGVLFIFLILLLPALLKGNHKILFMVIAWFFLGLLIESTVIPLEIIFEHRTYLPSVLVFVPLVLWLFRHVPRNSLRLLLLIPLLIALSSVTHARNGQWSDPLVFWRQTVAAAPGNSRVHNFYGMALHENNQTDLAISHYRQALALNGSNVRALMNLGLALYRQGAVTEAKSHLLRAMSFGIINDKIYGNLAMIYARERDFANARQYSLKAIEATGGNAFLFANLGGIYAESGAYDQALYYLEAALRLDNHNLTAHANLGNLYVLLNRSREAIPHYREVLRIRPDDATVANNLQIAYRRLAAKNVGP